jgi:hypothetical protein
MLTANKMTRNFKDRPWTADSQGELMSLSFKDAKVIIYIASVATHRAMSVG